MGEDKVGINILIPIKLHKKILIEKINTGKTLENQIISDLEEKYGTS